MFGIKRRRSLIRLLSFTVASFAVAVALAVTGFWMSYGLRMNLEYSYQRSLSELSDHMSNISLSLQKAKYAGTMPQLVSIAGEIRTESSAAKDSLSQISFSQVNMQNTTKFLSQVGDYANSISHSLTENKKLTNDERNKINKLSTNSDKLAQQLSDLVTDVQSGKLTLFKSDRAVKGLGQAKTKSVSVVASGFQTIENNLSGLPSMIYDGPFSDNVMKKMPELTKGRAAISRIAAKNSAAGFLGTKTKAITDDGETKGNLPTYNFISGTRNIDVTKSGGLVVRMLDSRPVKQTKLDAKEAGAKANAFLKARGMTTMAQTYSLTNNNICVINYAYTQDNVICYTDLMKIGVALDNGDIVSFDATGYMMNHKVRKFPASKISVQFARSQLSPELKEQKQSLALIPTAGTGEALCYEFKCKGSGNRNVIDYFNVQTGVEEQLLILLQTPGGTLAM